MAAGALLILANDGVRNRAIVWVRKAPVGTRVEFKPPKRTLPQNARMWAMLTDVATQVVDRGVRYTTEQWKSRFMKALGHEVEFLPTLDHTSFIPIGLHSSELAVPEMSDLMELIAAYGAEHGVHFNEPPPPEPK